MGADPSSTNEVEALLRRSHLSPSYDHDLRFEARNSEDVHKDALAASLAEHQRIRELALRAYQLNEEREAHEKLRLHALHEEERIRIKTENAEAACRLREIQNKERQIPKPAPLVPRVPTPPPVEIIQASAAPPADRTAQPVTTPIQRQPQPQPIAPEVTQPAPRPFQALQPSVNPLRQTPLPESSRTNQASVQVATQVPMQAPHPKPWQSSQPSGPPAASASPLTISSEQQQRRTLVVPGAEGYARIHRNLKSLRRIIVEAGKQNVAFKKQVSEMRRNLRMVLGQLTLGEGPVNRPQAQKATAILLESLSISSQGVDPSLLMLVKPDPIQGAEHNGEHLPVLFLFLLNHFAKGVVKQFVDEAGTRLEAAGPLGLIVATIFSNASFLWRGESLIDILMAKMWKVCPVLFGSRGNEKTEQGRERLGWRREADGSWIPEQLHYSRMIGLGAGYAAIALRNFGKTKSKSPWPPHHYWQTMATIVSTPPEDASETHYTVLKAMIENSEGKFLAFYGDAARAALRIATVDFPSRALDQKAVAVNSLRVLADQLERDQGLVLR